MKADFTTAEALLLLGLIPLVLYFARNSLANLSRVRRVLSVSARLILMFLIVQRALVSQVDQVLSRSRANLRSSWSPLERRRSEIGGSPRSAQTRPVITPISPPHSDLQPRLCPKAPLVDSS